MNNLLMTESADIFTTIIIKLALPTKLTLKCLYHYHSMMWMYCYHKHMSIFSINPLLSNFVL